MTNKLILGVVVGLAIGVFANPLMPPAFFVLGGLVIWWFHNKSAVPSQQGNGTAEHTPPGQSGD